MITDSLSMRSLALLICVGASTAVYGAGPETTESATIHFRQGISALEGNYRDNRAVLDSLLSKMSERARQENKYQLRRVRITGSASPEGPDRLNLRLSDRRANALAEIIRNRFYSDDTCLVTSYNGRDWQGLLRYAKADPMVPAQQEVIKVLDSACDYDGPVPPQESDRMLERLRIIDGGRAYRYLDNKYFQDLRYSEIAVDYSYVHPTLDPLPSEETYLTGAVTARITPAAYRSVTEFAHARKPFYMSLKTNMLYDILAIPNIGAEVYVGKNWSISADWMYGWWSNNSRHHYWRLYGGDIALRRWFGSASRRKPLTGHHVGVYCGAVTYDFEWGGKGYMGGVPGGTLWDRCQYIAGVEYGYSLPIGSRLNIDFTIGVGYRGGKYLEYEPHDNFYLWQSTHRVNWIGPTKAEISLVWLIGRDNRNIK